MAEDTQQLEILAGKVYDARVLVEELHRKYEAESSPRKRAAFIELEKARVARIIAERDLHLHEHTFIK